MSSHRLEIISKQAFDALVDTYNSKHEKLSPEKIEQLEKIMVDGLSIARVAKQAGVKRQGLAETCARVWRRYVLDYPLLAEWEKRPLRLPASEMQAVQEEAYRTKRAAIIQLQRKDED